MKLPNQFKRVLSFLLALVMVLGLMPVHAHAAAGDEPVDALVIFSDLHAMYNGDSSTGDKGYKQSKITTMMTTLKNTGLPFSSVHSAGDAFSSNSTAYTGYTDTITGYIQGVMGNLPVGYVWSDHDRAAYNNSKEKIALDKTSHLAYGAGSDGIYGNADDDNYYVYYLSMADLSTNDRYNSGFHSNSAVTATIAQFVADAGKLDQSKPLFVVSHQPLFDRRDDNGHALEWATAINQVAENMDVAVFFGHNHKYDKTEDYYYAKGSTMPVATSSLGSQNVKLNFTHICAGYFDPSTTGSTATSTRQGTMMVIKIYDDSIQYVTYNKSGIYTGNYALNQTVARDHAVTEPELVVSGTQSYFVGQALNITVSLKTGSKVEDVTASASITGFDMNTVGDQYLSIAYNGLSAQYLIKVRQKTFLDAATGISAQVSVPCATGLTVTALGTDSTAYQATAGLMSNAVAYEIDLENGTEATITLPIPAGVSDPAVYYVSADGKTVTRMDLVQDGSTVSFLADKFASFVIGEDDHIPEAGDVVVGDAKYSYVKVTSAPVAEGYYQLQNNHTSKYLTGTKTSGKNRLNLDSNGQNHIWYIKAVSGGYTIQYGGPDGQYLNFSHENAAMSSNPQTIQLLNSNGYWGIGATTGNPVAYLAREGTSSSSSSVHGYASSSYKYPGDEGMNWNLYQRVENQITYSVTAPNVSHYLGQNDDQVQLTYQLLANGTAGTAPAGGSWSFEIYKDKAGIIKSISDNGVVTFNKVEGSAYVKIAFTWSEGTVYMYVKVTAEVDPNACDHVYTAETVTATCTEDGYTVYTCQCGDTYTEVIPATGHSYEAVVTAPTCVDAGYTTYTCACGDSYVTDQVAALGHDYKAVVTAPTCETAGFTTYTCACGDSYVANQVAALGHSYKSVTTAATCIEDGSIVYTCGCGETYTEILPALGHDYKAVVTAPTCVDAGYTTYTCHCGDSYTADEVAALGHVYESVTTDATCTENGSIVYTCHCGDTYTEVIPALGHSYKTVVTAPTCEEIGYTTYTCACGYSFITDEVAALGHDYKTEVTAPTCEEIGYTTYTCACGHSYVADEVAALGHDYETEVTAPTCVDAGYTTYTCHCGDSYVADEVAALGHAYETEVTAPTCVDAGYTTYTCHCGDSYVADEVAALGHAYETEVTAPTCTENGSIVYTCACGDAYTEIIAALSHAYETVTVEPTCVAAGSVTEACSRCGETNTEVIPALGHSYETVVTAPTCTEVGYTTYTCHCGDTYVADEVAALGHDYKSVTTAATCTEDGSIVYTCGCGETYTEILPALGHDYKAVVTAPTCTEIGFTTYICACGDAYVTDEVAALGHSHEAVITAPTCEEIGYTIYTCACGDSYITDEVAALGHAHQAVTTAATCTEDGSVVYTCHCGDTYTEVLAALGHDAQSVTTAPTCETEGYTTHTCLRCGEVTVDSIVAALGHAHETVTVEPTCVAAGSVIETCSRCGETGTEVIPALGHGYEAKVTAPTCTEIGYTTYTCHCGDTYVADEVAALGHDYKSVTTAATCTEDGSIVYTCACGDTYTQVIAALGHSYEAVVTAPTCEDAGYTTYTCACGDSYVADQVAALGHDYAAVVTAPTCVAAGYTTYTCACGDSYVADQVAALGHDYKSVTTDATCTEDGATVYTCACGDSYTVVIPAFGHSYEAVVTAPTCENGGFTTYTCACGHSYTANATAALGHSYTTLEQNGVLIHTCGNCGHSYTESVAWIAVGSGYVLDTDGIDVGSQHKYIVVGATKDYALTVNGTSVSATAVTIRNNVLIVDDASKMELWFESNNSREKNTYLLTQDGSKSVYHVSGNINYGHDSKGYWYFGSSSNGLYQLYDKDGQSWYLNYGYVWSNQSANRFAVSSKAQSVRLFKQTDSYARLTGDLIQTVADTDNATVETLLNRISIQLSANGADVTGTAAVTADMLTWNVEFDGTEAGTYTAEVTYQDVKLGTITVTVTSKHNYVTTVVAPTCESQGYTERKCTECGASKKYDYTDALGHSYTHTDADGYRTYTCTRCDHSYSEKLSFTYSQVSTMASGERFVITVKSGNKYYALSHSGNNISAVQVTVSGGKITSQITEDLLWSYNDGKLSYEDGGKTYYLYTYTSGWWGSTNNLGISTDNAGSVSFSSSKLKIGSVYLRYSSSKFSVSSSSSTVYLFQEK